MRGMQLVVTVTSWLICCLQNIVDGKLHVCLHDFADYEWYEGEFIRHEYQCT